MIGLLWRGWRLWKQPITERGLRRRTLSGQLASGPAGQLASGLGGSAGLVGLDAQNVQRGGEPGVLRPQLPQRHQLRRVQM